MRKSNAHSFGTWFFYKTTFDIPEKEKKNSKNRSVQEWFEKINRPYFLYLKKFTVSHDNKFIENSRIEENRRKKAWKLLSQPRPFLYLRKKSDYLRIKDHGYV